MMFVRLLHKLNRVISTTCNRQMHFHSITFVCVACTRNECKSEREEKREKPLSVPALNTATNSFDWWEFVQCLFESDRQSILVKVEKKFYLLKKWWSILLLVLRSFRMRWVDILNVLLNVNKFHLNHSSIRYWLKFRKNSSTTMAPECPSWKCLIAVQRTWKFTKTQSNRVAIFCKRIFRLAH